MKLFALLDQLVSSEILIDYYCDKAKEYVRNDTEVTASFIKILHKINATNKFENTQLVDSSEIKALEKDLNALPEPYYNTFVYLLSLIRDRIAQECKEEISTSQQIIKEALLAGVPLPQDTQTKPSNPIILLLNFQKLYPFHEYKNWPPFYSSRFDHSYSQAIYIALGINALFLVGRISKEEYVNDVSFSPELQKINAELGKECIIFSADGFWKKGSPLLATNGSEIIYASDYEEEKNESEKIFVSRHNYRHPLPQINSDKFTTKKRKEYTSSGQEFWNSFSRHTVEQGC